MPYLPIVQKVALNSTTPRTLSREIRAFLFSSQLVERPRYLRFTHRSSEFSPGDCFANCEAYSGCAGAIVRYGWSIWEDRKAEFIEAEFHAIVCENGALLDITPRRDGETRILFAPDSKRLATRLSANRWQSWTNIKSVSGCIIQPPRQLEVVVVTRSK